MCNFNRKPIEYPGKPKLALERKVLSAIALVVVCGSLGLAILDESSRPFFADIAKMTLSGFLGFLIPKAD